jgi:hypothetical protein
MGVRERVMEQRQQRRSRSISELLGRNARPKKRRKPEKRRSSCRCCSRQQPSLPLEYQPIVFLSLPLHPHLTSHAPLPHPRLFFIFLHLQRSLNRAAKKQLKEACVPCAPSALQWRLHNATGTPERSFAAPRLERSRVCCRCRALR